MAVAVPQPLSVGQRIADLRIKRRLTQREIAEAIGVSPQTISNWERGVSHVPVTDMPALAEALGSSIAGLFNEDNSQPLRVPDTKGGSRPRDHRLGDGTGSPDAFNVAPLEEARASGVRPLPIYRWGSLGDPRDRESSPHPDREEYPPAGRERLIGPNGFGVDVRGDSMLGRSIHDGDTCWINPDRGYRLGDVVLALVTNGNGDSGMVVKTFSRIDTGEGLLSDTADGKVPVMCREYKIIGPVVGVQRWFPPR